MNRLRSVVRMLPVAAVVLALAGCSAPPEPEPHAYESPQVVGDLVSGAELESDEWVIAARKADVALAEAMNVADFTIEPFLETRNHHLAEDVGRLAIDVYIRGGIEWPVYAGPLPMLPLQTVPVRVADVENQRPREWLAVEFCVAAHYWTPGHDDAGDLTKGEVRRFVLLRESPSDPILWVDTQATLATCDATGAPVARFAPAPESLGDITRYDVVLEPTDREG